MLGVWDGCLHVPEEGAGVGKGAEMGSGEGAPAGSSLVGGGCVDGASACLWMDCSGADGQGSEGWSRARGGGVMGLLHSIWTRGGAGEDITMQSVGLAAGAISRWT